MPYWAASSVIVNNSVAYSRTNSRRCSMGDVSRHGIEAPPASWLPRPVAKSVTHVAGLKCHLCPWTEPSEVRSQKSKSVRCVHTRGSAKRGSGAGQGVPASDEPGCGAEPHVREASSIRIGGMISAIEHLVDRFTARQISRRDLVAALATLAAAPAAASAQSSAVAQGRTLNHASLAVR